jgi:hypothetical protein
MQNPGGPNVSGVCDDVTDEKGGIWADGASDAESPADSLPDKTDEDDLDNPPYGSEVDI